MINTISQAAINFCSHQMQMDSGLIANHTDSSRYIAYIDITYTNSEDQSRVYIACDKNFLQKITYSMLFEEESDEETLVDMILETANLVVGSAKVLASDDDSMPFSISTPHFEKIAPFDFEYDTINTVSHEDFEMTIAMKDLP
ncbi:MAG: chemotaxis protein CheX [Helicobacteraceae bacterium]|nr:chemotaxis protein CheX [Helicobacteraceae bacterium]